MDDGIFETPGGDPLVAVTADEMREVDRVAVEEVGVPLAAMMENAGRSLALEVLERLDGDDGEDPVAVLAGGGGNGGGGCCCARHLANRGVDVRVTLDRDPEDLRGVVARQWRALEETPATATASHGAALEAAGVAVDAVVGYGLDGAPRGRTSALVGALRDHDGWVLSLDVPSGVDATTGETPGVAVAPDRTTTLALPKTGLADVSGELVLADLGLPAGAFERAGIEYAPPFGRDYRVPFWAP